MSVVVLSRTISTAETQPSHLSWREMPELNIAITGITGSLGTALSKYLLANYGQSLRRLVGISRKWQDQDRLRKELNNDFRLRLFIGDIRDYERLEMAFNGIDFVIHAAALKALVVCQYNPTEAIRTNIDGTENVLRAAKNCRVKKVLVISSDKATQAGVNMYGATKAVVENLTVAYNAYTGTHGTRYAAVRYGNVANSSGSVIPLFLEQKASGKLTLTNEYMTRFMITMPDAVKFVMSCLEQMQGGEVFIPHLSSAKIMDIAKTIAPDAIIETVGVRPGEKIHEIMISPDEAYRTRDMGWGYVVHPQFPFWDQKYDTGGSPVPAYWTYSSASANRLSPDDIKILLES